SRNRLPARRAGSSGRARTRCRSSSACCAKRPTRSSRLGRLVENRSIHEALERDMADVLAFAEQRDGQIGGSAREAVSTAARLAASLGGRAHALTLGGSGLSAAAGSLGRYGAE